jgi:outer membrane protein
MFRLFSLPHVAACVVGLAFAAGASAQSKVAVVNFQKAILDTAEIKKAQNELQAKYKKRQDDLEKVTRELNDIQQQLQGSSGKLSAQGQADLEARGQRKQREAQRLQDDLQADVDADRNAVLQKSAQAMSDVVKKLAEEKGIDLVVDSGNAVFFKPTLDITADATAAYDKAHPAK